MKQIQASGKATMVYAATPKEVPLFCRELDIRNLLFHIQVGTPEEADELFKQVRRACAERRNPIIAT